MHKIELFYRKKHRTFFAPGSWDELTKRQLLKWSGVLRMELNKAEALTLAAYMFYNFPYKIMDKLTENEDFELRKTMRFLTQNNLTKNVIGYISVLGIKFHGPANRLGNLSIAEYRRSELYYDLYLKTKKKQFLYLLAATLFRPSGNSSENDIRCKLTEKGVSKRAKFFSWSLHPNALMAIKLFYEGCRNYIVNSHPKIYPKSTNNNSIIKAKPTGINDLEDHILAYSGGKLGNFNETSNTNLYVFFKHMTNRIDEYEQFQKKK